MKALVTGGSGFIGSTLIQSLVQRGVAVRALLRPTSSIKNLKGVPFERIDGDLTDFASLQRAVQGVDCVFHLAGVVAAKNRSEYFRFNAEGTRLLAKAAALEAEQNRGGPSRFIYVSTLAAGGPAKEGSPRTERDPDEPVSSYGESKRAGEVALLENSQKFQSFIVRAPIVFGPRDENTLILIRAAAKRVVPRFSSQASDGEKHYSIIHSEDLVEALIRLSEIESNQISGNQTFYIDSGEEITGSELMETIAAALGKKTLNLPLPNFLLKGLAELGSLYGEWFDRVSVINRDKFNEIRPDFWTCSGEKIKKATGWAPRHSFQSSMRDTVNWYLENGWLK